MARGLRYSSTGAAWGRHGSNVKADWGLCVEWHESGVRAVPAVCGRRGNCEKAVGEQREDGVTVGMMLGLHVRNC